MGQFFQDIGHFSSGYNVFIFIYIHIYIQLNMLKITVGEIPQVPFCNAPVLVIPRPEISSCFSRFCEQTIIWGDQSAKRSYLKQPPNTVDGSEILHSPVDMENIWKYPIICRFDIIPRWLFGISSINSRFSIPSWHSPFQMSMAFPVKRSQHEDGV